MQPFHVKSGVVGGTVVGFVTVVSYLVTSPNAAIGTAVGMILACVVGIGAVTLLALYGNRRPH